MLAEHDFHADPVLTSQGARVLRVDWFNQGGIVPVTIGAVLTVNEIGELRGYLGARPTAMMTDEAEDARFIAEIGCRISERLLAAYFRANVERHRIVPYEVERKI